VIAARRLQRHFADGFIAEAVEDLWEPWMRHADTALEDDTLLLSVQQELAKRCKKSKTRGRKATPAEVVLRMLLLKHVRDWSYDHPEYVQRTRPVGCLAFCRRRSSPPNVAIPEFGMRCEPDLLNQSIFAHGCDAHDVRVHLHDGLG